MAPKGRPPKRAAPASSEAPPPAKRARSGPNLGETTDVRSDAASAPTVAEEPPTSTAAASQAEPLAASPAFDAATRPTLPTLHGPSLASPSSQEEAFGGSSHESLQRFVSVFREVLTSATAERASSSSSAVEQ